MRKLVEFSVGHPRLVVSLTLGLTLIFAAQLPKIKTDTDPKNMLPVTSPVRQYNDQVEGWFALHPDVIVLGIRSEEGIFTAGTLRRIENLTQAILKIPGVIAPDVIALPTVDDVTSEGDTLRAQPLFPVILDRGRCGQRQHHHQGKVHGELFSKAPAARNPPAFGAGDGPMTCAVCASAAARSGR